MYSPDSYDKKILHCLYKNARLSHVALAEQVNLSPTQCARRIQQLETEGIISGYNTCINHKALGMNVMALVQVTMKTHQDDIATAFEEKVLQMDEILECAVVTGDRDYQLRVVARNLDDFSEFIRKRLANLPGIASFKTEILLERIKADQSPPFF